MMLADNIKRDIVTCGHKRKIKFNYLANLRVQITRKL